MNELKNHMTAYPAELFEESETSVYDGKECGSKERGRA